MKIRLALLWTAAQFGCVITIEIIGLAVLARLLAPSEIGAYAAAFAIVRLATIVAGFGLHPVVIRADALTPLVRSEVIGVGLAASLAVGTAMLGAAFLTPTAWLDPSLAALISIMALGIMVHCLGLTSSAELMREMRFPLLFRCRLTAALVFQAVAISLAAAGAGPAALAIGYTVSTAVFAFGTAASTGWGFLVRPRLSLSSHTVRFAMTFFALNTVQQAGQSLPLVLIGKLLGFAALGFFSRANDIVLQANRVVTEVVMNVLSPHVFRSVREGRDEREEFLGSLSRLTVLLWPMSLVLSALSGPVVRLLLGDQWLETIPILAVLALSISLFPLSYLMSTFAVAFHRERALFKRSVAMLVITLVSLVALHGYGLVAITAAFVVLQMVDLAVLAAIVQRHLGLTVRPIAERLLGPTLLSLACPLPALVLAPAFDHGPTGSILHIAAGGIGAAVVWLAGTALLRHPLLNEMLWAVSAVRANVPFGPTVRP